MQGVEIQPHIRLGKGDVQPIVFVCGDPARAKAIADLCDYSKEIAYNREYRSFDCQKGNAKFTVTSHGVGSSGAAIAFRELIWCGAKVMIRAGTAGSLQWDEIKTGDLVISYGACRLEGVSRILVPEGYPAVANPFVFLALTDAADELGIKYSSGLCVTTDSFYPPKMFPSHTYVYHQSGVKIVSMEESALMIHGTLYDCWTGVIHVVDGNAVTKGEDYDPTGNRVAEGKKKMFEIIFKAAEKLQKMLIQKGIISA